MRIVASGTSLTILEDAGTPRLTILAGGQIRISTVTNYADSAAAYAGGLRAGDVYRTGGTLKYMY
jgi:hypothetical protein